MAFKFKKSDAILKKDLAGNINDDSGIFASTGMLSCGKLWIDNVSGTPEGIFPKGAISEVAAAKGCGKSTLCLETIARNQKDCKKAGKKFNVLYVDFEHNLVLQKDMALQIGADLYDERFFYRQPRTLEGGVQTIVDALDPQKREDKYKIEEEFDLVVIDTLASAVASCELNQTVGTIAKPGFRAKLWSDAFRNIQAALSSEGPVIVVNNHVQQLIDFGGTSFHGPPKYDSKTSESLKYYASQRYFMTECYGNIEENETDPMTFEERKSLYALKVMIKCEKSKVGKPKGSTTFFIKPGEGFDAVLRLAYAAIEATTSKLMKKPPLGMTSEKSSWMYVPEEWDPSGTPKHKPNNKKYNGALSLVEELYVNKGLREQLAKNMGPFWEAQIALEEEMISWRAYVTDLRKDRTMSELKAAGELKDEVIPDVKFVDLNDFSNIK